MRLLTSFFIALAVGACVVVPVHAQDNAAAAASRPATDEQLRNFWSKRQSPSLLLALPSDELRKRQPENQPLPRNLREWLEGNDAAMRTFGGVTAVTNRVTFAVPKTIGPPDLFNTGNRWQDKTNATPQLLASLTAAQWREVASPQGLGIGGLSPEQRALFDLVTPNPFVVERQVRSSNPSKLLDTTKRTLSSAERRQVRLRVKLTGSAYATLVKYGTPTSVIFHKNQTERSIEGVPHLRLREAGAYEEPVAMDDEGVSRYGQRVVSLVPTRSEPLPVDIAVELAATLVTVSESSEGKSITVGDLLARIEKASGVKLCAGAGFRGGKVVVQSSGTVRADDLLRALLFVKDHTVRVLPPARVGEQPLYVIAPRREPLGRILGRIGDWDTQVEQTLQAMEVEANDRIAAQNPLPLLQFDADDPLPLSGKLRERVFAMAAKRVNNDSGADSRRVQVPIGELPTSAQKLINQSAQDRAERRTEDHDFRVRVDTIDVDCVPWISYIIPGGGEIAGEVDGDPVASLAEWLPKADTPEASDLKGRILIVAPETAEEAQALIAAAKRARAKEVWVQASPDIIASAIRAAGPVPVRAVVSLFRASVDTTETLPREENIYGKRSRDWLVPDDPEVVRGAAERVRSVAAVPGIAGIVLRDAIPPGYRGGNTALAEERAQTGDQSHGDSTRNLGYSLAHRRAFALETGADPADIPDDDGWHDWLKKRLAPLWSELRGAAAGKTIQIEGETSFSAARSASPILLETFVPWETKDKEPPFAALFRATEDHAPNLIPTPPSYAVILGNPQRGLTASEFIALLEREDKPERTVWDLSRKSAPDYPKLLRVLERLAEKP